ncbi:hypothetical protein HY572_01060 [Candidatus Micrarchaeota archaeon]|nr:hypothetical protein [Candidatus Micrarchaeota archaeon]
MRRLFLFLLFIAALTAAARFSIDNESTCACQFAAFELDVENLQENQFTTVIQTRSVLPVTPAKLDVRVEGLQTKSYLFNAYAACDLDLGKYAIELPPTGKTGYLTVKACEGIALRVTSAQAVCQNQHADFAVEIENLGTTPRDVDLGTDLNVGTYSLAQNVHLENRQKKTVILSVNTNTPPQRLPFKVFARSENFLESQTAIVDVSACQGIRYLAPINVTAFEGQNQTVQIQFQNLGKARTIDVQIFCPAFVYAPPVTTNLNGSATASVPIELRNPPHGTYSCTVFGKPSDEGNSYSHTFRITVQPSRPHVTIKPQSIPLEQGVTRPVLFEIDNTGTPVTGNVTFESTITDQLEPVPRLEAGETHAFKTLVLRGRILGQANGSLRIGTQIVPTSVEVTRPTLTFNATVLKAQNGVRVDFVVKNAGNQTNLALASNPATQGPQEVLVGANQTTTFTLFVPQNATALLLQAQTERGTYETPVDLSNPQDAPTTGFLTFSTPVLAFATAILLALILLYFLYRESQTKPRASPPQA